MSPILVTLTSRSDSDFERSNVSLKENKPDSDQKLATPSDAEKSWKIVRNCIIENRCESVLHDITLLKIVEESRFR